MNLQKLLHLAVMCELLNRKYPSLFYLLPSAYCTEANLVEAISAPNNISVFF